MTNSQLYPTLNADYRLRSFLGVNGSHYGTVFNPSTHIEILKMDCVDGEQYVKPTSIFNSAFVKAPYLYFYVKNLNLENCTITQIMNNVQNLYADELYRVKLKEYYVYVGKGIILDENLNVLYMRVSIFPVDYLDSNNTPAYIHEKAIYSPYILSRLTSVHKYILEKFTRTAFICAEPIRATNKTYDEKVVFDYSYKVYFSKITPVRRPSSDYCNFLASHIDDIQF